MTLTSKIIRSLFFFLNVGAFLWLFLCKFASLYDTASAPSLVSLVSFSVFFAYAANVFFVVFWLFTKRKPYALLSLVAIVLCWSMVQPIVGLNYFGNNRIEPGEGGLKVMTWNVHLFDLGEWTEDETSKAKILNLISEENPDILCVQEFYWDEKQPAEPYTSLIQQLGYPYVKLSMNTKTRKRRMTTKATKDEIIYIGDAVFSKYPLQNEQTYPLARTYKMLSVDVLVDSFNTFNVNVVHLTSVGFGEEELDYIDDIKSKGVQHQEASKSKGILKKLMKASSHRADLVNKIDSIKRFIDLPMIICGDFNDVPGSYAYQRIKGDLSDAFEKKGAGLGRTYIKIFPTLRIDYILYDASALEAIGYNKRNVGLSDHFPVMANFNLRQKTGD